MIGLTIAVGLFSLVGLEDLPNTALFVLCVVQAWLQLVLAVSLILSSVKMKRVPLMTVGQASSSVRLLTHST